jgi:hypothetical protein
MSSSLTADGLRFQSLLARIDVTFSVSFIQVRKTTGERLPSAALPKKSVSTAIARTASVKYPGQVPGVIVPSPSSNLSREAID